MSSSKVNDQPAVVDLQTNDNGKAMVYFSLNRLDELLI